MLWLLLQVAETPDLSRIASEQVALQECRSADKDEIIVCGRRERSPYRLPERKAFDPEGDQQSVMREKTAIVEVGDSGIQSCGPVGPGGWTGCKVRQWKAERDQTAWGKNVPKKW